MRAFPRIAIDRVEKDVTRAAKRRAKADREAAKLDDMPRPIVDAPAALIVKRAMDRKVVKDAQRQANMLSRLKQGARAPLGVAVAEALRTTKDAADAEFRQSRGRKPRQLGLSTPGLPLTTRDLVKSQAAEIAAQKERERLEAAKRRMRMIGDDGEADQIRNSAHYLTKGGRKGWDMTILVDRERGAATSGRRNPPRSCASAKKPLGCIEGPSGYQHRDFDREAGNHIWGYNSVGSRWLG